MDNEVTDLEQLDAFASSRGGLCLSSDLLGEKVAHQWQCAQGHQFEASPRLLVVGGYWCPSCFPSLDDPSRWDYDTLAEIDPLIHRFHRTT